MTIHIYPFNCYITGLPARTINSSESGDYFVEIDDKEIEFRYKGSFDPKNSQLIKDNLTILRGEIYNGNWPIPDNYIDEIEIKRCISSSSAPKTPKEKFDKLFLFLCNQQDGDGKIFESEAILYKAQIWNKLYLKDSDELNFYLFAIENQGLIITTVLSKIYVTKISITFTGLNYQIELTESGANSNNCFIAMSFDEKTQDIREAIRLALNRTGYNPIIIDETHFDAEKTINDEIIASIKKSKFCISDFTQQKDGVYFEAGYALGRGLKVIYTCSQDWFGETHFDTNHFPHIIYKDPSELTEKLVNKIEAWIK